METRKYKYPASEDLKEWLGESYICEKKYRHPSAVGQLFVKGISFKDGDTIVKTFAGRYHNLYVLDPDGYHLDKV